MTEAVEVVIVGLDKMLSDGLTLTSAARRRMTDALAESVVRFDDWLDRAGDFGQIQRTRKAAGGVNSPIRTPGGQIIQAHQTAGPWPVRTGASMSGWTFEQRGINADLFNQIAYSQRARRAGERAGEGVRKVTRWIEKDWALVAENMADAIEDSLGGLL